MNRIRRGMCVVVLAAAPLSMTARAQAPGSDLLLSLETRSTYIDNFFYAPDNANQDEAWGVLLKPSAALRRETRRLSWSAAASGEVGSFDQPRRISDYADHRLDLDAAWSIARRHRLSFAGAVIHDHNSFGTERTELSLASGDSLDKWRQLQSSLTYRIGAPTDRLNVDLIGSVLDRTYTSNKSSTRFLNYSAGGGGIVGWYNYSPKTSYFASVGITDVRFDEVAPGAIDRGAKEHSYRAGVRWAATAKTTGEVALGYFERDLTDPRRKDFNNLDWQARITWAPVAHRNFVFGSGRASQESYIAAVSFINNEYYLVEWNENWTPRLLSTLSLSYIDAEFVGSLRRDSALAIGLGGEYRVSRSLSALAGTSWVDRDSTRALALLDYERLQAYLGIRITN